MEASTDITLEMVRKAFLRRGSMGVSTDAPCFYLEVRRPTLVRWAPREPLVNAAIVEIHRVVEYHELKPLKRIRFLWADEVVAEEIIADDSAGSSRGEQ